MSLLREIQERAVDGSTPIADVLRRCAILAARVDNAELRDWVNRELNGYRDQDELPGYRVLAAYASGHFTGPFGSGYRNLGIPAGALPEKYRNWATRIFLRQPIAEIVALATTDAAKGSLSCPWPQDLVFIVGNNIMKGMQLFAAWQDVSQAELLGVVDTVRNRVLDFALQLEKESPSAGEESGAVSSARVGQLYQTIIVGNVSNVASGEHIQQTSFTVNEGDWTSLATYLTQLGVPGTDVADLQRALEADGGGKQIGTKTASWIGSLAQKATSGAVKIGSSVASGLVVKAIAKYLGLE